VEAGKAATGGYGDFRVINRHPFIFVFVINEIDLLLYPLSHFPSFEEVHDTFRIEPKQEPSRLKMNRQPYRKRTSTAHVVD